MENIFVLYTYPRTERRLGEKLKNIEKTLSEGGFSPQKKGFPTPHHSSLFFGKCRHPYLPKSSEISFF